ncbi:GntR family transcriptional regulator [Mammaliicoccus sciuri]|uniref:GntR family transcriptional regulator n=1 Tax=Mammaliicoccus sciuri TaxID=1296 RepID=UPI0021CF4747|nr:GntR family transcriptional regulator [Mammaliicoccus sciuri]UXU83560.1 GntR family transcriptional regulator [Mammaliicoccus sciuri]
MTKNKNEKMIESELAQRYNVSRIPIREAIKQLELEYFIRDGYIYVPSVEEYQKIAEMLEKRQTEAAIELMKEHLLNDLEFSLYYLKS